MSICSQKGMHQLEFPIPFLTGCWKVGVIDNKREKSEALSAPISPFKIFKAGSEFYVFRYIFLLHLPAEKRQNALRIGYPLPGPVAFSWSSDNHANWKGSPH